MSIILMAVKAISLVVVTFAAFLALAGAIGADLTTSEYAGVQCAASSPHACLFMIM